MNGAKVQSKGSESIDFGDSARLADQSTLTPLIVVEIVEIVDRGTRLEGVVGQ